MTSASAERGAAGATQAWTARAAAIARELPLPGPVAWTAMIAGLSVLYFAFVVPLGRGTDETQHAFRAYQLASGHLFPQIVRCAAHPALLACRLQYPGPFAPGRRAGGQVSLALYQTYDQLLALAQRPGFGQHFDPQVYARGLAAPIGGSSGAGAAMMFAHFENTALYSPVNYLPQTLVFWIGRETGASVVGTVFAARLATGIVWAASATAAVALAPRWQWLVALVVLVPTALTHGAMLATDSSALALAALAIACSLRVAARGGPVRRRDLAVLAALCLLLGLLKVPMPVFLLAVLAIVWPVLGSGTRRARNVAAIALPGLAAATWWTLASNAYFVPYRDATFPAVFQVRISPTAQESHLLSHIYELPALLWNTLTGQQLLHLGGLVGTIGQDGGAGPLPEWVAVAWLLALAVLVAGTHEGAAPRGRMRAALAGTGALYMLVVALGLYFTWTALRASAVNGIHGRYTTPALILLVPMLAGAGGSRLRIHPRVLAAAVIALTTALTAVVFVRTADYYYGQAPWDVVPRVLSAVF